MLKTKLILAVATLAFAVSCTKSSDTTTAGGEETTSNIDMNVSRLSMNGILSGGLVELDFGAVAKNKTSSKSITIKNDESAAMPIAITLENGDSTASFMLISNSCPVPPATLAVNKSCVISVKGTGLINGIPAPGTASIGSLKINGESYQASLKIAVTGNAGFEAATDADLIFTTTALSDTTYTLGRSQTKSISVKNNSALGTHPGNISIAADGWVMTSSTCVAPLGPQKSCAITMSYSKWQTESAPSISYQASSASGAIAVTATNGAAATTCKPAATRVLKTWKTSDKKSEIITTANVGSSTAPVSSLVKEAVQQYSVGAANVLEVCNSDAKSVSIQLDSCASGFHKVEPKSMPGATASDFYCEPDTVTCN